MTQFVNEKLGEYFDKNPAVMPKIVARRSTRRAREKRPARRAI